MWQAKVQASTHSWCFWGGITAAPASPSAVISPAILACISASLLLFFEVRLFRTELQRARDALGEACRECPKVSLLPLLAGLLAFVALGAALAAVVPQADR